MKRTTLMLAVLGLFLFGQSALADWTPAKRITWTAGESASPAVAVDSGGATHVVWSDDTPGNAEIYYRKSEDGGTTWSWTQRLAWTTGKSYHPAIDIDSGGTVHVVWDDDTPGDEEIYYRKSEDGGSGDGGDSWGPVKRLTWHEEAQWTPSVAVNSSGHVYVVWQDSRITLGELYYRSSTDQGATWSSPLRLTWTEGYSNAPAAAASGNKIHIVWYDGTPGNYEIYYKSGN